MGVTFRTNILEYMLVYFTSAEDEKITEFTLEEIRILFATRYRWSWDGDLEFALHYLVHERSSRGQPGLVMDETKGTYSWQPVLDEGRLVYTSQHFSAHAIQGNYEMARDAEFDFNFDKVYQDAVGAYERINGVSFSEALNTEDAEYRQRIRHLSNTEIDF